MSELCRLQIGLLALADVLNCQERYVTATLLAEFTFALPSHGSGETGC